MIETQTTICNKALNLIGEEGINSINDNSLQAVACKNNYDLALATVLEEGKWTFATVECALVKVDTDEYSEEQKYVYSMPANCVLISRVYNKHDRKQEPNKLDWDIRYIPSSNKKYIVCDSDEDVRVEYVYSNTNINTYPASFINTLVARLAFQICMYVTKDLEKTNAMLQLYQSTMADSMRKNYNEDGEDKMHWKSFLTSSRG